MAAPHARILVIDDEVGYRDLLSFELEGDGYEVLTAADGESGVAMARLGGIDAVVTDMTMPSMSGLDTLTALKALDPRLEVILMTGHATAHTARESAHRGAYAHILKPFQVDDLRRLLAGALEKRRAS